jgi:hypothetical protein
MYVNTLCWQLKVKVRRKHMQDIQVWFQQWTAFCLHRNVQNGCVVHPAHGCVVHPAPVPRGCVLAGIAVGSSVEQVWRSCDGASWKIRLDVPISQIYFGKKLHVSDSSSVHHQQFFTVHTAMVYVIQVCWQLASRIRVFHVEFLSKINLRN